MDFQFLFSFSFSRRRSHSLKLSIYKPLYYWEAEWVSPHSNSLPHWCTHSFRLDEWTKFSVVGTIGSARSMLVRSGLSTLYHFNMNEPHTTCIHNPLVSNECVLTYEITTRRFSKRPPIAPMVETLKIQMKQWEFADDRCMQKIMLDLRLTLSREGWNGSHPPFPYGVSSMRFLRVLLAASDSFSPANRRPAMSSNVLFVAEDKFFAVFIFLAVCFCSLHL